MNRLVSDRKRNTILAGAGAVLWALGLFILSSLPLAPAEAMQAGVARGLESLIRLLFNTDFSPALRETLAAGTRVVLQMGGFAVLSLLIWNALRVAGASDRRALVLGFSGALFYAVTDELHQLFVPGRLPRVADWAWDTLGAFLAMAVVLLWRWAWRKFPRLLNRETVSYVVFGVLTTLVNMAVYGLSYNTLGIHNLISNAIAWTAAVLFAYAVNKLFVFHSHVRGARALLREFGLFIGARLLSFAVDELCMGLLVNVLAVNGGVSKILVNIIVMVMNYFFSKWFIFRKERAADGTADSPAPPAD